MTRTPHAVAGRLLPLVADLGCVAAFALAGRSSHEPGASGWVVLAILWPYAVAALVAHAGLGWAGRASRPVWPGGVLVVAVTYALGMVLRVVSGRGIAVGFLVVAALFLALTMLGWRALTTVVTRGRAAQEAGRASRR